MAKWLPIETAPKDCEILGWLEGTIVHCYPEKVFRTGEFSLWRDYNCEYELRPSHWQPLLEAPNARV